MRCSTRQRLPLTQEIAAEMNLVVLVVGAMKQNPANAGVQDATCRTVALLTEHPDGLLNAAQCGALLNIPFTPDCFPPCPRPAHRQLDSAPPSSPAYSRRVQVPWRRCWVHSAHTP